MGTFVTTSRSTRGADGRENRSAKRAWVGLLLAGIVFVAGTARRDPTINRRVGLGAAAVLYSMWPDERVLAYTGPWLEPADRLPLAAVQEVLAKQSSQSPRIEFHHNLRDDQIDWQFAHEPWESPGFQELRTESQSLRAEARDVFELSDRLRALTTHAPRGFDGRDDPLSFLRMALRGEPLTCRYFAVAFVGLCLAEGYTARLIGLSATGDSWDHAVAEVYLPQLGKWVLIDPDFNIAYRRGEQWLSASEVQEGWRRFKDATSIRRLDRDAMSWAKWRHRASALAGIEWVALGNAGADLRQSNLIPGASGMNIEYFEYVYFAGRNDYLANEYPKGHPTAVRQFVLLAGPRTDPVSAICPEAEVVTSTDQLYGPIGWCRVDARQAETAASLEWTLSTMTPNFGHFEIRQPGDPGWRAWADARVDWEPGPGRGILEVRSVNTAGVRGEPARVVFTTEAQVHRP